MFAQRDIYVNRQYMLVMVTENHWKLLSLQKRFCFLCGRTWTLSDILSFLGDRVDQSSIQYTQACQFAICIDSQEIISVRTGFCDQTTNSHIVCVFIGLLFSVFILFYWQNDWLGCNSGWRSSHVRYTVYFVSASVWREEHTFIPAATYCR